MTPQRIRFRQLGHHWQIYLFALPAFVLLGLFQYYPALSGVLHSLFRWNGADINEFVGFENYARLIGDEEFWRSFRIALILGVWNIAKMVPAVAVAVCIHRCRSPRLQFIYRLLFVAPMVMPVLVVVLIWRGLFFEATSGYLNDLLLRTHLFDLLIWADRAFHFGGIFTAESMPAWLGDGRLILIGCIVWGFPWVGSFAVLTHLAKLQNIPRELYEAADLDGASWFRKFTRLELPLMMGSINLMLVLVIIDTIKDAATIIGLAGLFGGPGGVVTVPALYMLREAMIDQKMGAACAVGIILTVVVLGLQKLMGAIIDWKELSRRQKFLARAAGFGAAFLMYGLLHSILLTLVTLAVAFPWGEIRKIFSGGEQTPSAPLNPALTVDAWATSDAQQKRVARLVRLRDTPAYRLRERWRQLSLRTAKHGFIWLILLFAYLPLYFMLIVSLKNNTQFYDGPAAITTPLHWENWAAAWRIIIPPLANSIFVTTLSTALTLLLALGAAYFFARVKVPGSTLLWNAVLILMMMPTIANLIPLMRLLIDLNLYNTLTALVLVGAAGGQVFAIFILRNFVADIPQSLFEAADLDGAGHLRQLFTIVAPLSGPILGVIGVMHAIGQWNDFILPWNIIRDQSRLPVMVELLRLSGEYIKYWGPMMAGYALASLPIIVLFILCMRLFARGLTEGAEKG